MFLAVVVLAKLNPPGPHSPDSLKSSAIRVPLKMLTRVKIMRERIMMTRSATRKPLC